MKHKINSITLALIIGIAGFGVGEKAYAVDDFLDEMFISTRTGAQTWESQTRRGATLGSFHARTPVSSINLFRVDMPRLRTGSCGAIDLHLGSFSHVNMDQAVELMKQIGSGALAVLFSIALEQLSNIISNTIHRFVDRLEALNRHFQNTCEISTMIAQAASPWNRDTGPIKEWGSQIGEDLCSLVSGEDNRHCKENMDEEMLDEHRDQIPTIGNLVYRMLTDTNLGGQSAQTLVNQTQTLFGLGSPLEAKEVLMAFTGTVINCPDPDAPEGDYQPFAIHPTLTIEDLLRGRQLTGPSGGMTNAPPRRMACLDYDADDPSSSCCAMESEGEEISNFVNYAEEAKIRMRDMILAFENAEEGALSPSQQDDINTFLDSTSLPVLRLLNNLLEGNPAIRANFEALLAEMIAEEWESRFLLAFRTIISQIGSHSKIELPPASKEAVEVIQQQIDERRITAIESVQRRNSIEELITRLNQASIQFADNPAAALPYFATDPR